MTNAIATVLWPGLHAMEPSSELGGIYANKPGYHNKAQNLPSSDYSRTDFPVLDNHGPVDEPAAIDWTFPEAKRGDYGRIKRYSTRLLDAGHRQDPRTVGMREFFGNCNGDRIVDGWSFTRRRSATSDRSHLWHIHISIHRMYVRDESIMHNILAILHGTVEPSTPVRGKAFTDMFLARLMGFKAVWLFSSDRRALRNVTQAELDYLVSRGMMFLDGIQTSLYADVTNGHKPTG